MRKKVITTALSIICVLGIIIYTQMPKKIRFESMGTGLAYLTEIKENRAFPPEILLIKSIEDWKNYMDKYIIMIGPGNSDSLPEGKVLLIVSLPSAMDSKSGIYGSYIIENIKKKNNELLVYLNSNKEPTISSQSEVKSMFYGMFFINSDYINSETKVRIVISK